MAIFTLLDLVHKLKEIVQELVNENYSLLGSYGYCSADGLKEVIEDYPGAVAMPPSDDHFFKAVANGHCLGSDYPAKGMPFHEFDTYILEPNSEWIVNNFLWEPGDPPLLTDLVFVLEFTITNDAILPRTRELRVI